MKILDSIKIKNVLFQNRVVMAPMVPFGLPVEQDGSMGEEVLNHYIKRTANEMGLMISQSLSVTSQFSLNGGVGVFSDLHKKYLSQLVQACHEKGVKFFAQLAYPGTGYLSEDFVNSFSEADLENIKSEFVRAAKICKESGCDGIEFHGAHGYLLNMFACPITNKRNDKYGGDINGRLFLINSIVKEIRAFTDDNFIISYRMGWNDDLNNDIQTAKALENMGIELLHVSIGVPAKRKINVPEDFPYNSVVYTAQQIKKSVTIPVIAVNDIRTLDRGNTLVENNSSDLVAYGRPFLADEGFLTKSLNNHDFNPLVK